MTQRFSNLQGAALVLATCMIASSNWAAEPGQVEPVRQDASEEDQNTREGLAWDFWFPRAELSAEELNRLPAFCAGAYRWPEFPHPRTIRNEDFPIEAESRRAQYWESGEVLLEGDVVVTQGNRSIASPRAELNHVTREGRVLDGVQMEDPEVILRGSEADMNLDTKATTVREAEFLLLEPEFRGTAATLERDDAGNMLVTSGTFTRCEPTNNNWRISSRSFDIKDGSDFGTARHAVIRVKDVPVFYTPYLSFPVNDERKSGWLFPSMGYSSQNGIEFSPP